jgi:hypothetical protein
MKMPQHRIYRVRKVRYPGRLIDELAKGRALDKILRQ